MKQTIETIEIDDEQESAEIEKGLQRLERIAKIQEIKGICRGVVYRSEGRMYHGYLQCSDGTLVPFLGDGENGASLAKVSAEINMPVLMQCNKQGYVMALKLGKYVVGDFL